MISVYRYQLPFSRPFYVSGRHYNRRNGIVIRYRQGDHDIISEIAPLPGFSSETDEQALASVISNLPAILRFFDGLQTMDQPDKFFAHTSFPPSVEFGLSTLAASLLSQKQKVTVSDLFHLSSDKSIAVNGIIGIGKREELIQRIGLLYKTGFRTIKIKSDDEPGDLPAVIRESAEKYSDLKFRIDANRGWPSDKALEYLHRFADLPIEYCEEPIAYNDIQLFRELKNQSPLPLALDESIKTSEQLTQYLADDIADVFILKPMLHGNIFNLIETIRDLNTHSNIVCTTLLESGIGRCITGQIAALIGGKDRAHGLDTGKFFKTDLYPDPVQNAYFKVHDGFGWGLDINLCDLGLLNKVITYPD